MEGTTLKEFCPAKHALSKIEGTPMKQNPKSEYRNSKQTQRNEPKPAKSKTLIRSTRFGIFLFF
jgi:hypothetical protein